MRRVGALAAVAGGLLRIADSFASEALPRDALTLLYLVTDIFLLGGVAALWFERRRSLGIAGSAGIGVFVLGILTIRASALGFGSYSLGAAVALAGLALYSIETLATRRGMRVAPLAWLTALALGIAGASGIAPALSTALAGVAFGAGFVAAGVALFYKPQSAQIVTSTFTQPRLWKPWRHPQDGRE